jgi:hypothetical protein
LRFVDPILLTVLNITFVFVIRQAHIVRSINRGIPGMLYRGVFCCIIRSWMQS